MVWKLLGWRGCWDAAACPKLNKEWPNVPPWAFPWCEVSIKHKHDLRWPKKLMHTRCLHKPYGWSFFNSQSRIMPWSYSIMTKNFKQMTTYFLVLHFLSAKYQLSKTLTWWSVVQIFFSSYEYEAMRHSTCTSFISDIAKAYTVVHIVEPQFNEIAFNIYLNIKKYAYRVTWTMNTDRRAGRQVVWRLCCPQMKPLPRNP